jgi:GntR family transcriptional regulator, sialic acid-inducible nan operon repressor
VLSVLQDQRHTSLQHHDALAAAIQCHGQIFEAIAAREPDRAEQVMRRHLTEVETYYWDVRGKHAPRAGEAETKAET